MPRRHRPARLILPALLAVALPLSTAAAAEGDAAFGRELFHELCAPCHGRDMISPGGISFDLRTFPQDDAARFRNSVLNGKGNAMPPWADKINEDDLDNLWAYVRSGR